MLEYISLLLAISLVLVVIFNLFKKRIPLNPPVMYGAVGISFALGAVFPMAISKLTPGGVLAIYFGLIILSSAALSYAENRSLFKSFPAPLKPADLEKETSAGEPLDDSFSSNNLAGDNFAMETCSSFDTLSMAEDVKDESTAVQLFETGLPVQVEDRPAGEEAVVGQEFASPEDKSGTEDSNIKVDKEDHKDRLIPNENQVFSDQAGTETKEPGDSTTNTRPSTINDYISAGFKARAEGNLAGAAEYFFKALELCREQQQAYVALALEISAVYQNTGQYAQAGMILRSIASQENITNDPSLKQILIDRIVFLDTLDRQLKMANLPGTPYSKVPSLILIKTNLETSEKLKELDKGGITIDKQPTNFRATGS